MVVRLRRDDRFAETVTGDIASFDPWKALLESSETFLKMAIFACAGKSQSEILTILVWGIDGKIGLESRWFPSVVFVKHLARAIPMIECLPL
jgi:hypothetical protein